jgi:hypothetical protein
MADEESAATMDPFASADDLAAFTKGSIPSDDTRAASALDGASTAIRRYCGWHIAPPVTQSDVRIDSAGGRILSLETKFLTALPQIIESNPAGDLTLLEDVDYIWSELGEVERLWTQSVWGRPSGEWPNRYRSLTPTMTHGHDLADVADLQQVVLAAVARGLASPQGATREGAGAMSVQWTHVAPNVAGGVILMQHELQTLASYRI